jgi:hypothetical protein
MSKKYGDSIMSGGATREKKFDNFIFRSTTPLTLVFSSYMRLIGLLGLFSVKRVARFSTSMLNMSSARVLSTGDMETLIQRVQDNNLVRQCDLEALDGKYTPFVVDGRVYGYCQADFVRRLRSFPAVLSVEDGRVTFAAEVPGTAEDRTEAMATITSALRADGTITGWRDELLPVVEAFSSEPVFLIERAAYAHFGTKVRRQTPNTPIHSHKPSVLTLVLLLSLLLLFPLLLFLPPRAMGYTSMVTWLTLRLLLPIPPRVQ